MMNRRLFTMEALAFTTLPAFAPAQSSLSIDDAQFMWSLLIARAEQQPGRGYLVAQQTAVPDELPCIQSGVPRTAIQKAMDSSKLTGRTYETQVPQASQQVFLEALQDASLRGAEVITIERLNLSKPYRLLTAVEISAYSNLAPPAVPQGWKQDTKTERRF